MHPGAAGGDGEQDERRDGAKRVVQVEEDSLPRRAGANAQDLVAPPESEPDQDEEARDDCRGGGEP